MSNDVRERAYDRMTTAEAFDAVRHLVEIQWETGGKTEDQILDLTRRFADDPALWGDWLEAIDRSRAAAQKAVSDAHS